MLRVMRQICSVLFENSSTQNRIRLTSSAHFGLLIPQMSQMGYLYDLKSCSTLQVILMQGTNPRLIDQRGSGPIATLKSNFAKLY